MLIDDEKNENCNAKRVADHGVNSKTSVFYKGLRPVLQVCKKN